MFEISEYQIEESVQKKRHVFPHASQQFTPFDLAPNTNKELRLDSFSAAMVDGVCSDDLAAQLEATAQFRKRLSEPNPPVEEVVLRGFVLRFVQFLGRDDSPQLQLEAAWVLRYIASSSPKYTPAIICDGAIPVFVKLLRSANVDVCEQAVWALGNIAGGCPMFSNLVLHLGALSPLLALFNETSELPMLRNASWTLSNFCGGSLTLKEPLPVLMQLIGSPDDEILANACWALAFLCGGAYDNIQAVIDKKFCPILVELLARRSPSVLSPTLCTLGFIATRGYSQTILEHKNCLPQLKALLEDPVVESIRKEVCTTISTITEGTSNQIQAVIEAGLIPPLLQLVGNAVIDIKAEAARALSNATRCGTPAQIMSMIEMRCIHTFHGLLDCSDETILQVCLEVLENTLKVAFGNSKCDEGLIPPADDLLSKLIVLTDHDDLEILDRSSEIYGDIQKHERNKIKHDGNHMLRYDLVQIKHDGNHMLRYDLVLGSVRRI